MGMNPARQHTFWMWFIRSVSFGMLLVVFYRLRRSLFHFVVRIPLCEKCSHMSAGLISILVSFQIFLLCTAIVWIPAQAFPMIALLFLPVIVGIMIYYLTITPDDELR